MFINSLLLNKTDMKNIPLQRHKGVSLPAWVGQQSLLSQTLQSVSESNTSSSPSQSNHLSLPAVAFTERCACSFSTNNCFCFEPKTCTFFFFFFFKAPHWCWQPHASSISAIHNISLRSNTQTPAGSSACLMMHQPFFLGGGPRPPTSPLSPH